MIKKILKNSKESIINYLLPIESKRRMIVQYAYRCIKTNDIRKVFIDSKKVGMKNSFKKSFRRLVIPQSREYQEKDYMNWISENESKIEYKELQYNPKISIVTPIYNTPIDFFIQYLESIKKQNYNNWEICIADASDTINNEIKQIIDKEEKIKYIKLEKNLGIAENTNEAIKLATGEYIALVDHDDVIAPFALYEIAKVINENKTVDFIYSDEDKFEDDINDKYNRYGYFFKPDFSIDFLRSNNYICHLSVIKKNLLDEIGGFRKEYDGAQDYDMFLRISEKTKNIIHISKILYHWRVSFNSTSKDMNSKMYAIDAGKKALEDHLKRCGLKGNVIIEQPLGLYRIKYEIIDKPFVSIIIPNKDSYRFLKRLLNSIENKTKYSNYEILIIENNSESKKIFKYYDRIQKNKKNIKVIYYKEKGFNYSKLNNYAIDYAKGEYILLLNNDMEVIKDNWLNELVSICQRDDVGIVGAKLLYRDKTVQHAGVVLGMGGIAGHVNRTISDKNSGYFARTRIINNFSAVTGACLLTKKSIYKEVNGLDENFAVAFNDVDFCMKVRKKGYLIVMNPYAKLYHYESKTRGYEDTDEKKKRFESEINKFKEKWNKELKQGDPYFNRNFDLQSEQYVLKYNK